MVNLVEVLARHGVLVLLRPPSTSSADPNELVADLDTMGLSIVTIPSPDGDGGLISLIGRTSLPSVLD